MLPLPRNSFSNLLICPFGCTVGERQCLDGHQWWTSADAPAQHCTYHKRVAFAGSSPSPHILMLCQQLLSLTSDCAGNIGFSYTKSFTQRASKDSTSSFAWHPHIERLFHLGKCSRRRCAVVMWLKENRKAWTGKHKRPLLSLTTLTFRTFFFPLKELRNKQTSEKPEIIAPIHSKECI